MGESNSEKASVAHDIIRSVFAFLDKPAYWLLGLIYQLFFNVASADLFSSQTIMSFYGRVQAILGVFMMFQLAMTILRGIIEPDNFTKDKGAGSLVRRIVISLLLITTLMPVNIPNARNEYEAQINNNGLLFGTLYSLQHRMLANNTLGRLVLGTTDSNNISYMNTSNDTELKKASRKFTSTILKGFYRINLVPEDKRKATSSGDPATLAQNRMCPNIDSKILNKYTQIDADPNDIIDMVNETCTINGVGSFGEKRYVFNYMGGISTIVALIFVFILLSFTIDVAVRSVKLAVLRLIAPIPLISYMNPSGKGDEAFKAWTKALTSTYLDLFIRLAVVYFVIFLIQDMIKHGIVINHGSGVIGILSLILIWIGLFIFAKQAPKFIKDVLGIKGDSGGKLFGGFGEIAAAGTVGLGAVGGAVSGAASKYGSTSGNQGKKILAGIGGAITGGVGGTVNAGKGFFGSKDFDAKANMAKIRDYNARNYSNAADESTPFGRFAAGFQRDVGLRNQLQKFDDKIKYYGAAESAMKRITNAFDGNGDYKHHYTGPDIRDSRGQVVLESGQDYTLKGYKDIYNRVQSSGDNTLISQVDSAMKKAQGERFAEIRRAGRAQVEANIANGVDGWSTNDLIVFDSAKTIYDVATKYSSEPEFGLLSGVSFDYVDAREPGSEWGKVWKHDAGQAGKSADQIKNSDAYAQAKANAQRAEQTKK